MFAKIFEQIFDSSIAEDWQTRHVFEDILKLADRHGIVDKTPEAIARRTNVPLEIVKRAIAELEKPDARSRNPEHDGRRIVRLDEHRDWGWRIVNYDYYRLITSEDQRREKTMLRGQRFREKCKRAVTHRNAGNAMQRQMEMQKENENVKVVSRAPGAKRAFARSRAAVIVVTTTATRKAARLDCGDGRNDTRIASANTPVPA